MLTGFKTVWLHYDEVVYARVHYDRLSVARDVSIENLSFESIALFSRNSNGKRD